MSITSTELQQIASRLRLLATETRKAAEAKDLDADDWETVDVFVEAYEETASNLDAVSDLVVKMAGYLDEIPDLQ